MTKVDLGLRLAHVTLQLPGYWLRSFFGVNVYNTQKRTRQKSSHLDRTGLDNKGFIIMEKEHY